MTDRISGLFLLGVGVAFAIAALQLRTGFTSDNLGPKAFPLILAGGLVFLSICLLLRPGRGFRPSWPSRSVALGLFLALLSLVLYANLILWLGFLVSTALEVFVLCLLYQARPLPAAVAGVLTSLALFGLFDWLLGLPLPNGTLFAG
ncbi:MAG: tripartite tricarboxylate transporter TctB family protein [Roseitalea sp.]|jgi:putative tricarboxylic transport membrane protein|nr:tripartite tricarboxylate transporter TctB family protein [Roseitalea sp.]MBO6720779.1 tripartite tricarboxylate transporter TctB family protein [Roseitalea sp.]MBO6743926.1 tripartite tricarboxylate transporter TctB family protein [Roseitalea sp.]